MVTKKKKHLILVDLMCKEDPTVRALSTDEAVKLMISAFSLAELAKSGQRKEFTKSHMEELLGNNTRITLAIVGSEPVIFIDPIWVTEEVPYNNPLYKV